MQIKPLQSLPRFVTDPDPSIYEHGTYLVLDYEGTNLDKGSALNPNNRAVCWSWTREDGAVKCKFGTEYDFKELIDEVAKVDFIVAHNAKFDLQWLVRCGLDIGSVLVYDTMLADYVLLGNQRKGVSLNACCQRHGLGGKDDLVSRMMNSGICPSDMPKNWLKRYVKQDVKATHNLFKSQMRQLKGTKLLNVVYTRCLLTPVLADMETKGLAIDYDRTVREYEEALGTLKEVELELSRICGPINLGSPVQLGKFLFEDLGFDVPKDYRGNEIRTPTGRYKVDDATISLLKPRTAKQRTFKELILQRAKVNGKVSKYLQKMKDCCEQDEGILYANFNQAVTKTHRLSSSGRKYKIQLQNIDNTLKSLFTARNKGWLVIEVDGSALEFRVGGYLGHDAQIYHDIVHEEDIHRFTASVLNNKPEDEITSEERRLAKPDTFGPMYGKRSGTPAQQRYFAAFRSKYSDLYKTQEGWANEVLKEKKLETPWGLIFYWPDTTMLASGYITNSTKIFNGPIQCLATAEIIPIALVYLWYTVRAHRLKGFLTSTVHDSVIGEFPPEERELFQTLAVQCFTDRVYEYLDKVYDLQFDVPLGVGIKVGTHWSEGKEVKVDSKPPYQFN